MARSISVKVPVSTLITQIESKIAEIDEAVANYPSAVENYNKERESYKENIAKLVGDYLANNTAQLGFDYDSVVRISTNYSGRIELTLDTDIANLPKPPVAPEKPNQPRYYGRDYVSQRELLEKNLKILRMTTQEEVNASTYGAVMDIL